MPSTHLREEPSEEPGEEIVPVGRIGAPFGVKGWVRVRCDMEVPADLLDRKHWQLRAPAPHRGDGQGGLPWVARTLVKGSIHGDGLVALLEGVDDRDVAAGLRHFDIGLPRSALGRAEAGEYFWIDLVGLPVTTREGQALGTVDYLLETGSNDVLVIRGERERLVPFIMDDVVLSVTLRGGESVNGAKGAKGAKGEKDLDGNATAGIVVDWDPQA